MKVDQELHLARTLHGSPVCLPDHIKLLDILQNGFCTGILVNSSYNEYCSGCAHRE